MNRSTIYDYLKNLEGFKPLFYKHGKGYHVKFVPEVWIKYSQIVINDWWIEDFYSIILLIQGIVVEGETGDMKVHVDYKDIEYFDVQFEEGYKVKK